MKITNIYRKNLRKKYTYKRKNKKCKGGNKLKVAIFFSGRINSFEDSLENLKAIKNKYEPIFFCSLNSETKTDNIKKFCDIFNITEEQLNIESTKDPTFLHKYPKRDEVSYYTTYSMFYHDNKNYKKIEEYSSKHNIIFDIILKYRADINSDSGVIELQNPEENHIYIPEGHDYIDNALNALIAYGNSKIMKIYCNIVNNLEQLCIDGTIFHSETLLKKYLENNKIDVTRFKYHISLNKVRKVGNNATKYK